MHYIFKIIYIKKSNFIYFVFILFVIAHTIKLSLSDNHDFLASPGFNSVFGTGVLTRTERDVIFNLTNGSHLVPDFRTSDGSYLSLARTDRIIVYLEQQNFDLKDKRVYVPGAGTGLLVIYAALKGATVLASEIQQMVCEDMIHNIRQAGLEEVVDIRAGHLISVLEDADKFDLIICHPPIFRSYYGRGNVSVYDKNFSFITGITDVLPDFLNENGRIVLMYPSEHTAINYESPEEDIYLFNLAQKKESLKKRGFSLFDAFEGDNTHESTMWEIINNNHIIVPLRSDCLVASSI